jgi:hypothetical protein
VALVVLNLAQARFECTFGRGCDGICCKNGRPPVYPEEAAAIQAALPIVLPRVRPETRGALERDGFLTRRRKAGQPTLRVVGGWCVFFHRGCVLHHLGLKPSLCALFPLAKDARDRWYVRQKGYGGEVWDLPCLAPGPGTPLAADSLRAEIALAERLDRAERAGDDA